jgi:hypothetical protein
MIVVSDIAIVLMDIMMPEMDVRKRSSQSGTNLPTPAHHRAHRQGHEGRPEMPAGWGLNTCETGHTEQLRVLGVAAR